MKEFLLPVRVYYEDTDAGGVVYYANYLKFMERARTEWLRSLGFEQDSLRERSGVLFAVRAVRVDYRRPARFNDALLVSAQVTRVARASLSLAQKVHRTGEPDVLCSGDVEIVSVDADSFKPRPIPEAVRARIPVPE